ncbi:unnamed protein product, partial [Mesorhabditis spiculigera]
MLCQKFSLKHWLRNTSKIEAIYYGFAGLHIGGTVFTVTFANLGFYIIYKDSEDPTSEEHLPLGALLALILLNVAWLILTIVSFVITVIGMRKRILLLAHGYPAFIGIDIRIYANDLTDGLLSEAWYQVGLACYFLPLIVLLEWLSVKCWRDTVERATRRQRLQYSIAMLSMA